ncbi:MAG: S-methyl-5-thioribose-1-phosphate isomerase [Bacteroidota bacterium]
MHINGQSYHTIWLHPEDPARVRIIDQRPLPHQFVIATLDSSEAAARAIREMWVRGAPLIGATAAYGMYLAALEAQTETDPVAWMQARRALLFSTRPTAVNLRWALQEQDRQWQEIAPEEWPARLLARAQAIVEEDVQRCYDIGRHGLTLLEKLHATRPDQPLNILTHCNAGWMACLDWGTATSPIYQAHAKGIPVHVWVDETRPRNQGARITAWELAQEGVPHTVIVDNVGGHLMQQGMVDCCIVGTDRTTRQGDVANKIGTYLKALAAHDNDVPFYVALPSPSIDWGMRDGLAEMPIETRGEQEVTHIQGWDETADQLVKVRLTPEKSHAVNYGFDTTPARLVTALITEKGVCPASETGLAALFPSPATG